MVSCEVLYFSSVAVVKANLNIGVTAPLASITLVRTMSFSIYQKSKYFFDSWIFWATGKSPLVHANTRGASPSLSTVACFGAAGAVSGALITGISCESN